LEKSNNTPSPGPMTVEQQALTYLRKNHESTVQSLFNALKSKNPALTEIEITNLAWRLANEGRVTLEDIGSASNSIREYVRLWDQNLSLYFALGVSLMTILVVYALPTDLPLAAIRWVLGSIFVFFIPGYVTVEALFPKGRELDGIERWALSVGLSLALVPLIGLILNYTPWGIRLTPIMLSLALFTFGVAVVGLVKRFRLAVERFVLEKPV
jgi:hypothetical protein